MTSQDPFETFLRWLSPDRDLALMKHAEIMRKITKHFVRKSCPDPEELSSETRDRVIRIVNAGGEYPNHQALFYSVANKVWYEDMRKEKPEPLPDVLPIPAPDPIDKERQASCLETCLAKLPQSERDLITRYYQDSGRDKIETRRLLAAEHGGKNTLRIKAFRTRSRLRVCIDECMSGLPVN